MCGGSNSFGTSKLVSVKVKIYLYKNRQEVFAFMNKYSL